MTTVTEYSRVDIYHGKHPVVCSCGARFWGKSENSSREWLRVHCCRNTNRSESGSRAGWHNRGRQD